MKYTSFLFCNLSCVDLSLHILFWLWLYSQVDLSSIEVLHCPTFNSVYLKWPGHIFHNQFCRILGTFSAIEWAAMLSYFHYVFTYFTTYFEHFLQCIFASLAMFYKEVIILLFEVNYCWNKLIFLEGFLFFPRQE